MKTLIAKTITNIDGVDSEYIYIFDDEIYNEINNVGDKCVITLADAIFERIGHPEFIGKFGHGVGFSTRSNFDRSRVIEVI